MNVSTIQLMHQDFVSSVAEVLAETGINPAVLELEVTESFLLQNEQQGIEVLYALKELGVALSMDDFGTGFSSLSYLKKLPLDQLKIDQSFVQSLPDDAEDLAIVEAIIAVGKAVGVEVIAEGAKPSCRPNSCTTKAACWRKASASVGRCRRKNSSAGAVHSTRWIDFRRIHASPKFSDFSRPSFYNDVFDFFDSERIMAFSKQETTQLLALKGVGPTVIQRLEEIGIDSFDVLRTYSVDEVVETVADKLRTSCWKNSPQARAAVAAAIELAGQESHV